jgi:translocation and assembly module TamA
MRAPRHKSFLVLFFKKELLLFLLLLPLPAHAADPVPYTVTIDPTGTPVLDAAIAASAQLVALRTKAPASPFALVARARLDVPRVRAALESFGFYQASIAVEIDGSGLDNPDLPDKLTALPGGEDAKVAIHITTGKLFHLHNIRLVGTLPAEAAGAFTLRAGAPAVAADVVGARDALSTALREHGYALARVGAPEATEIPDAHALDVTFHVSSGPRVDLGPIAITGLARTHESYVRRRLLLKQGQLYQPTKIEAAREDLASAGVFSGVKISTAPTLNAAGQIPVRVDVTERKLHAVSFDIAYSTDLGGSAGVTWSHRNLFGNAEQLNLSASVTGLGGSADKGLGYAVKAQLLKPDFLRRDQTIELDAAAIKQDLISYNQTAETAGPVLSRKLSESWSVSIGLAGTRETIEQEAVTKNYTLLAVPVTAKFDSTAVPNALSDPLRGVRLTLLATPTASLSSKSGDFVILQGTASTYFDLHHLGISKPGSTVIALRGLVGSAEGATNLELPPDQRFYGSCSATVRGYRYQSIGPSFADSTPEGGAAIDAASIELRQRVWGKFGAVAFADAGQVSAGNAPFQGRLEEGAGIGARYYTAIGPIRVDIAVPLDRIRGGDSFDLYLGLGQAF